jgi:SAM-dependent methyltransferase
MGRPREVDEQVVQRIMDDWQLLTSPARPGAEKVDLYRSALQGARSAMVMGATPELIDMLLVEGIDRVAAIDLHPETMEALRRLASKDWARVELVVGDWREPRAAWSTTFDLVLCDGGLMFLPFPDDWRTVLAVIHGYLRPGGRLVASQASVAPTETSFRDHYAQAIARFDSERPDPDPTQQTRRFMELASQLRSVTRYGAVDHEGRVRLDAVAAARRWIREDLRRRYPEFGRIVDAHFGRSSVIGIDGAGIVAGPPLERVRAEIIRSGFTVEVLRSIVRPPRHSFTLAATRPL